MYNFLADVAVSLPVTREISNTCLAEVHSNELYYLFVVLGTYLCKTWLSLWEYRTFPQPVLNRNFL